MLAEVSVVPDSRVFSLSFKNNRLKIAIRSPAKNNLANIELITGLSKMLGGRQVRIISGLTSKRKKLSIDISPEDWSAFLAKLDSV